MQPHMRTELVSDALRMAWFRRRPQAGLILHSDRGSQYCSHDFQDLLKGYGMRSSMSRKGNCYDNATIESFWSTLKNELLEESVFPNREEARQTIFKAIEVVYNRVRIHSSLGYQSPVDFENQTN